MPNVPIKTSDPRPKPKTSDSLTVLEVTCIEIHKALVPIFRGSVSHPLDSQPQETSEKQGISGSEPLPLP